MKAKYEEGSVVHYRGEAVTIVTGVSVSVEGVRYKLSGIAHFEGKEYSDVREHSLAPVSSIIQKKYGKLDGDRFGKLGTAIVDRL